MGSRYYCSLQTRFSFAHHCGGPLSSLSDRFHVFTWLSWLKHFIAWSNSVRCWRSYLFSIFNCIELHIHVDSSVASMHHSVVLCVTKNPMNEHKNARKTFLITWCQRHNWTFESCRSFRLFFYKWSTSQQKRTMSFMCLQKTHSPMLYKSVTKYLLNSVFSEFESNLLHCLLFECTFQLRIVLAWQTLPIWLAHSIWAPMQWTYPLECCRMCVCVTVTAMTVRWSWTIDLCEH